MKPDLPALDPLKAALHDQTTAEVRRVRDQACAEAAVLLNGAREQADAILARAREAGRADGEAVVLAQRSQTRRRARATILAARRMVYDDLRRRILASVRAACTNTEVLTVLAEQAHRLLGPAAQITELPGGGLVAETPGRVVDLSAEALAEAALDRLGAEVSLLWEPESAG